MHAKIWVSLHNVGPMFQRYVPPPSSGWLNWF